MSTYKIKKGNHYSRIPVPHIHGGIRTYQAIAVFDSNCLYESNSKDSKDLNKLCGFTYGFIHKNSIRIAWLPTATGRIGLYLYLYNKGKRYIEYLDEVEVNKQLYINLTVTPEEVICKLSQKMISIERGIKLNYNVNWGVLCYPYFGGNDKAPKDMSIKLSVECSVGNNIFTL